MFRPNMTARERYDSACAIVSGIYDGVRLPKYSFSPISWRAFQCFA